MDWSVRGRGLGAAYRFVRVVTMMEEDNEGRREQVEGEVGKH